MGQTPKAETARPCAANSESAAPEANIAAQRRKLLRRPRRIRRVSYSARFSGGSEPKPLMSRTALSPGAVKTAPQQEQRTEKAAGYGSDVGVHAIASRIFSYSASVSSGVSRANIRDMSGVTTAIYGGSLGFRLIRVFS